MQISKSGPVDFEINGIEVAVEENTRPIKDNGPSVKVVVNGGVVSMLENCDLYMETWMKDEEYPISSLSLYPYIDKFSCQGKREVRSQVPEVTMKAK